MGREPQAVRVGGGRQGPLGPEPEYLGGHWDAWACVAQGAIEWFVQRRDGLNIRALESPLAAWGGGDE